MTMAPATKQTAVARGTRNRRRLRTALLLAMPLLFGACSMPDWADPFSSDYGPVPQPVTRAGGAQALPPAPGTGLVADTGNARHTDSRTVSAANDRSVTDASTIRTAQAPAPRTAPAGASTAIEVQRTAPEQPAAKPMVPSTVAPPRAYGSRASAAARDAQLAREQIRTTDDARRVLAESGISTSTPATTAPADRSAVAMRNTAMPPSGDRTSSARATGGMPASTAPDAESPTPMIAAMTRGQTPPTFSQAGETLAARRTSVESSAMASASGYGNPSTDTLGTSQETMTTGSALAAAAQTGTSPGVVMQQDERTGAPSSVAMMAPTLRQPVLEQTYQDQLRASGMATPAPTTAPRPLNTAPGEFPNSVSPVIRQTYMQSLSAPRTYEQAIGAAPGTAPSSVVIGGNSYGSAGTTDGPVVISRNGVSQPVSYSAGGYGAASGAAATIHFGHNSTSLSAADRAMIRDVARRAMDTGARVRVVGHASSRTREQAVSTHLLANLRVSADRAEAVADELARNGVPYARITVKGEGDNQPLYNEAMPSGENGNRRAEIFLEY